MQASIQNLKRSCRCAELGEAQVGQRLTLMGWCHKQRDLGGLIFINLRDRSGEVQLIVGDEATEDLKAIASKVRSEFVLAAVGTLRHRESPNPEMPTGAYELLVEELRILSQSETPPFYIEDGVEANESLRLKHRYLDLRRPEMQKKLMLRHKLTHLAHRYFDQEGFLEIETPMLGKSTPEGARDYLVPSRVKKGSFFALPQSPQLYKQLLMVSGMDRYVQIARCFRDEDLRADRQPEFTQIDLEMAFVNQDDVMSVLEGYLAEVFRELKGVDLQLPLPRLPYVEAMRRFGSDKPDLRFEMELQDLTDAFPNSEFPWFKEANEKGEAILGLVAKGAASFTRKQIDSLAEYVKTYRLRGLVWLVPSLPARGSILKFMNEDEVSALAERLGAGSDDLILISTGALETVQNGMGMLRCELAKRLGLLEGKSDQLLWVTEFPLLEYDEEAGRYVAKHHPFTAPMDEDVKLLESNPAAVRAKAYDMVLNGTELGGGSIRIHDQDLQKKMFALLGFSEERAWENFGFLLEAFKYGVPPHGGLAVGLDRLVMLLSGAESLREVIAFPKVQTSSDLMTDAPGLVSQEQLDELAIGIRLEQED